MSDVKFFRHGKRQYFSKYKVMNEMCKMWRGRADNDLDTTVMITGYNGTGKSTLGEEVCYLYDDYYQLERQAFYKEKGDTFATRVQEIVADRINHFYIAIKLDEMKNQFDSQDPHMSISNKLGSNEMTENREDNMLIVGCTPFSKGINRYMRQDRIKYWIFVYERGKAVMIKNLHTPLGGNWYLHILEDTINKAISKGRPPTTKELLKAFRKMPNTWKEKGRLKIITFPDLPDDLKKDYKSWKRRKRLSYGEEKGKESSLVRKYQSWVKMLIKRYNVKANDLMEMGMPRKTAYVYAPVSVTTEKDSNKEMKGWGKKNKNTTNIPNILYSEHSFANRRGKK